jgi:hypothetical protein
MSERKFDVFISHAQADSLDARRIAEELRSTGKSVFLDEQSLQLGDDWDRSIRTSLEQSSNVVVLISCNSLTSQSSSYEMGLAVGHARRTPGVNIVPVVLDDVAATAVPAPLRSTQWINVSKTWDGAAEAINRALTSAKDEGEV